MSVTTYTFGTISTPDEWSVDGTALIARRVDAATGVKVTRVVQIAGNATVPTTATINSVVGSFNLGAYNLAFGDVSSNNECQFRGVSGGVTGGTVAISPLTYGFQGTSTVALAAPGGTWTSSVLSGLSIEGVKELAGEVAPARVIWVISNGGVWAVTALVNFTMAAPSITTSAASNVTLTTATLNGIVNPNGANASFPIQCNFYWGLTTAYGNVTSTITGNTGTSDIPLSANLTGLVGSTTYHYRLVGVTDDNTTNGFDQTFTTSGGDAVMMRL